MATTIKRSNGKISATYKDQSGTTITEPLAYTRWNLASDNVSITAYNESTAKEETVEAEWVALCITSLASGIASLTQNTYQETKVNYEVKLEGV